MIDVRQQVKNSKTVVEPYKKRDNRTININPNPIDVKIIFLLDLNV